MAPAREARCLLYLTSPHLSRKEWRAKRKSTLAGALWAMVARHESHLLREWPLIALLKFGFKIQDFRKEHCWLHFLCNDRHQNKTMKLQDGSVSSAPLSVKVPRNITFFGVSCSLYFDGKNSLSTNRVGTCDANYDIRRVLAVRSLSRITHRLRKNSPLSNRPTRIKINHPLCYTNHAAESFAITPCCGSSTIH